VVGASVSEPATNIADDRASIIGLQIKAFRRQRCNRCGAQLVAIATKTTFFVIQLLHADITLWRCVHFFTNSAQKI
jgi:hypothetical protein